MEYDVVEFLLQICVAKGPPAVRASSAPRIGRDVDEEKSCHKNATRDTSFTTLRVEDVLQQIWNWSHSYCN